jgi:glycosyltransferase involved in cell wall biosynthesis
VKVALVHDWLTGMRGGERVLERLCRMFPDAPLYTLVWNRGSVSRAIESRPIHTSFLQSFPDAGRRYRWFLPLFPRAIESLRLPAVDVVISTSHAVARAVPTPPGAFHLSYIHTPMRYVWELERDYFPPGRFPWPLSWYVSSTCARLRRWEIATRNRAHALVANSAHVAKRIRLHYGREARVIPPPVDVERFTLPPGPRDYYLLAGAMAPYKRGELAIEACVRLGRRLIVAGTGPMAALLRRHAGPNVEFRDQWIEDDEMARLYAGARALLYPGEEDFGIIPVEAMAAGCPVIAYGVGGALETAGRGATPSSLAEIARGGTAETPGGMLFGTQSVEAIVEAIGKFEELHFAPESLAAVAAPFSSERFDADFRAELDRTYGMWRAAGGPGREVVAPVRSL